MNNDVFAVRVIYVHIYIQMDYSLASRHLAHLNMNAEGHFLTSRSVLKSYGLEKKRKQNVNILVGDAQAYEQTKKIGVRMGDERADRTWKK